MRWHLPALVRARATVLSVHAHVLRGRVVISMVVNLPTKGAKALWFVFFVIQASASPFLLPLFGLEGITPADPADGLLGNIKMTKSVENYWLWHATTQDLPFTTLLVVGYKLLLPADKGKYLDFMR